MPNINQMRIVLISAYPGTKWKNRVSQMSDNQVVAIFHNLEKQEEKEKKEQEKQMRLF